MRYVLAKFATSGSGAALELGPSVVQQLAKFVDDAEATDTDEARLTAYDGMHQIVSWLRLPYDQPDIY